jgi:hypothetical protein
MRQAVSKHLAQLEAPDPVAKAWRGREELRHLNPAIAMSAVTVDSFAIWSVRLTASSPRT